LPSQNEGRSRKLLFPIFFWIVYIFKGLDFLLFLSKAGPKKIFLSFDWQQLTARQFLKVVKWGKFNIFDYK
jgi:hypothetical protein